MQKGIAEKEITKYRNNTTEVFTDCLAIEEPLEIQLIHGNLSNRITKSLSVTMRTPGNDEELAIGFLFTEGLIENAAQIDKVQHAIRPFLDTEDENVIQVTLNPNLVLDLSKLERNFYTTSSCGVCGKSSIDAIRTVSAPSILPAKPIAINSSYFTALPNLLREAQEVFDSTGGLHAAALFNTQQEIVLLREDVGRHNALDKLIGAGIAAKNIDWQKSVLLLSGRASFELIQKAAMVKIPVVCAVGAPSSLAVELAQEFSITLIGFLKEDRFNIYTHPEIIIAKA
jgi:FdhD protein